MKKIIYPLSTLLFLFCMTSLSAQKITGKGSLVKETISLSSIEGISLAIPAEVEITKGSPQKIVIEAKKNIIENIERDVDDQVWQIGYEKNVNNSGPVKIYITMASLKELSIAGSGNVKTTNQFSSKGNFKLSISGSGSAKVDIAADEIDCNLSGSGNVHLKGSASDVEINKTGSGSVEASDLATDKCNVNSIGSGSTKVHAKSELKVSSIGSGNVYYKGDPKTDISIMGSGDVKSGN